MKIQGSFWSRREKDKAKRALRRRLKASRVRAN